MIRIWYSHEHEVNFLGIPKCGSSTVRASLGINVDSDWDTAPIFEYKCFTVLRHPLSRILSGHQETLRRKTCFDPTFEGFINRVNTEGFFDEHIRPMAWYYSPRIVDFTFIMELNFMEEIKKLTGFNKIITGNISNKYDKRISQRALDLVHKIYQEDFILYEQQRKHRINIQGV